MSGKGSKPRPLSVSQENFNSNWDTIFGKKKKTDAEKFDESVVMKNEFYDEDVLNTYNDERLVSKFDKYTCWCYNCNKERKTEHGIPFTLTHMILCPKCGNKRCPHSTDHNLECTNSNDPNQPGSRYQYAF